MKSNGKSQFDPLVEPLRDALAKRDYDAAWEHVHKIHSLGIYDPYDLAFMQVLEPLVRDLERVNLIKIKKLLDEAANARYTGDYDAAWERLNKTQNLWITNPLYRQVSDELEEKFWRIAFDLPRRGIAMEKRSKRLKSFGTVQSRLDYSPPSLNMPDHVCPKCGNRSNSSWQPTMFIREYTCSNCGHSWSHPTGARE
jgi:hypothetical protein